MHRNTYKAWVLVTYSAHKHFLQQVKNIIYFHSLFTGIRLSHFLCICESKKQSEMAMRYILA